MPIAARISIPMVLLAWLSACADKPGISATPPPGPAPERAAQSAPAPTPPAATAAPAAGAKDSSSPRLVCHGGTMMLVRPRESSAAAGRRPFYLIFQVKLDGFVTNDTGEGLPPGYCGFVGKTWVLGDPPQVNFVVRDAEPSPETWMLSEDSYWSVPVAKAHGYFDAKQPVQRFAEPVASGQ